MRKSALILTSILLISTTPCFASDQTGHVITIGGDTGNPFVFQISGTRTSRPSCATDDSYVIPAAPVENARSLLALVTTALGAGRTISVHGTGACSTLWPNREEVAWLWIS